jgi:uncharacterized protein (TIGR00251 family)
MPHAEPPIVPVADGVEVAVWVVPGASTDRVGGSHGAALRVRVTAPPEKGRANRAAAAAVAAALGGRRGAVVAGERARAKRILVTGVGFRAAEERLAALLDGGERP